MFKSDSDGAEAMRKLEKSVESLVGGQDNATETRMPLKNWIY
jgi:hypothetical protein